MNFSDDSGPLGPAEADEADPPQPARPPVGSLSASARDALLELDIVHVAGDWSRFGAAPALIEAAAAAWARHRACRDAMPAAAAIALSADEHVKQLNGAHRGKDRPTNVLSFPYGGEGVFVADDGGERFLGDIVLAAETIQREAPALGASPDHHLQHLVVHGLLHLIGYDHESDDDARQMEAIEIEILRDLGIDDPYAARAASPANVCTNEMKTE